jgi:hypothetical protein
MCSSFWARSFNLLNSKLERKTSCEFLYIKNCSPPMKVLTTGVWKWTQFILCILPMILHSLNLIGGRGVNVLFYSRSYDFKCRIYKLQFLYTRIQIINMYNTKNGNHTSPFRISLRSITNTSGNSEEHKTDICQLCFRINSSLYLYWKLVIKPSSLISNGYQGLFPGG